MRPVNCYILKSTNEQTYNGTEIQLACGHYVVSDSDRNMINIKPELETHIESNHCKCNCLDCMSAIVFKCQVCDKFISPPVLQDIVLYKYGVASWIELYAITFNDFTLQKLHDYELANIDLAINKFRDDFIDYIN